MNTKNLLCEAFPLFQAAVNSSIVCHEIGGKLKKDIHYKDNTDNTSVNNFFPHLHF